MVKLALPTAVQSEYQVSRGCPHYTYISLGSHRILLLAVRRSQRRCWRETARPQIRCMEPSASPPSQVPCILLPSSLFSLSPAPLMLTRWSLGLNGDIFAAENMVKGVVAREVLLAQTSIEDRVSSPSLFGSSTSLSLFSLTCTQQSITQFEARVSKEVQHEVSLLKQNLARELHASLLSVYCDHALVSDYSTGTRYPCLFFFCC